MRIQKRNPKNGQTHIASTVDCAAFWKMQTNSRCLSGGKIPLRPPKEKDRRGGQNERRFYDKSRKKITGVTTVTRIAKNLP